MTTEEIEILAAQVSAMQIKLAAEQSHQRYDGPAVQINQASGYAREMRKWESTHTQYGAPGRPYPPPGVSTEYPRAMFKAGHPEGRPGLIVIKEYRDAGNAIERASMESVAAASCCSSAGRHPMSSTGRSPFPLGLRFFLYWMFFSP